MRRRVQQDTLSRRGHKDDPLYKIRGLLPRGREHLSDKYQQLRAMYQASTPAEGKWIAEHVIASFHQCPVPKSPASAAL